MLTSRLSRPSAVLCLTGEIPLPRSVGGAACRLNLVFTVGSAGILLAPLLAGGALDVRGPRTVSAGGLAACAAGAVLFGAGLADGGPDPTWALPGGFLLLGALPRAVPVWWVAATDMTRQFVWKGKQKDTALPRVHGVQVPVHEQHTSPAIAVPRPPHVGRCCAALRLQGSAALPTTSR